MSQVQPLPYHKREGPYGSMVSDQRNGEDSLVPPPPDPVGEFARSCVGYVERAVGVRLDFCVETLPLLDHYLREARKPVAERQESVVLLRSAVGAYLGEVLRRRHSCSWRIDDTDDPMEWRIEFDDHLLTVYPVALAHIALIGAQADEDFEFLHVERADREPLEEKLSSLPPVSEEDYLAPSTRLEVIDIAVDTIRLARRMRDS